MNGPTGTTLTTRGPQWLSPQLVTEHMADQDLTLRALAEKAAITPGYLSKLLNGKARGREDAHQKIADALGVDVTAITVSAGTTVTITIHHDETVGAA